MTFLSKFPLSITHFLFATWLLLVEPVFAAEDLFVPVLSAGVPVAGAEVALDGVILGQTSPNGSLLADISRDGTHALVKKTRQAATNARFTAAAGQLVDAVVRIDLGVVSLDVYSRTEGIKDRKTAAEGTVRVRVTQGERPATQQSIYIAGLGLSLQTDGAGEASVTLPRGHYRAQVAEKTTKLRVVGGLTRVVKLEIDDALDKIELASPALSGFFASFIAGPELPSTDNEQVAGSHGAN